MTNLSKHNPLNMNVNPRILRIFRLLLLHCVCAVLLIVIISIVWSLIYAKLVYQMGWNAPAASAFYYKAMKQGDVDEAIYWAAMVIYNENHRVAWTPISVFCSTVFKKQHPFRHRHPSKDSMGNELLREAYQLKEKQNKTLREEKSITGEKARSTITSVDWDDNTFNGVKKETGTFAWKVGKINSKPLVTTVVATNTGTITVYTILAEPSGAWNAADTKTPKLDANNTPILDADGKPVLEDKNDEKQPWVTALEFAIQTAGTNGKTANAQKTADEVVLAQLTTFLYAGYGLKYDTVEGGSRYTDFDGTSISYFDVTNYMTKQWDNPLTGIVEANTKVNCYDQAAALTEFGRLLGISVEYVYASSFGYINTATLVGGIETNSPFNGGTPFDPVEDAHSYWRITTNVDDNVPVREAFGNHAFAMLGNNVYDACAGSEAGAAFTGTIITDYLNGVIEFEANWQWNYWLSSHPDFVLDHPGVPFFLLTADDVAGNKETVTVASVR